MVAQPAEGDRIDRRLELLAQPAEGVPITLLRSADKPGLSRLRIFAADFKSIHALSPKFETCTGPAMSLQVVSRQRDARKQILGSDTRQRRVPASDKRKTSLIRG